MTLPAITVHLAPGVSIDGAEPVRLRRREAEVLRVLAAARGGEVGRDFLLKAVWGDAAAALRGHNDSPLDAHLSYLRAKLATTCIEIARPGPGRYRLQRRPSADDHPTQGETA